MLEILNYRDVGAEGLLRWLIRGPNFDMRLVEIEAHQGLSETPHTHPWEHEIFIVEGNGVAWDGKEKRPLGGGDSVYIPSGEPHTFINEGEKPLRFICCIPAGVDLNQIKSVNQRRD